MLHRFFRITLLFIISVNIVMAVIATFMYPPLLSLSNSGYPVLELLMMLLFYVILVIFATRPFVPQTILTVSAVFGVITSLLEIVHISIENFGHLTAKTETVSTGIFMGSLILLFAVSGYYVSQKKRSIVLGMWTGLGSAVVCMLIVMTYGLSLLFWAFQALEKHDTGDPDFIRTGWSDMHAFVIADIFEACFKILFFGPVIGIVFGLIGAALARIFIIKKIQGK